MAVFDTTATVARNLYFTYGGNPVEGITSIGSVQPGGSAPDVDLTDLQSVVRQFAIGLTDPGQSNCSVLVDMSTPAYQALVNANETGTSAELRLVVGYAAPGTAITDGSGFQTHTFPGKTGAKPDGITVSAGSMTIAKAQADSVPGVKAGHYIGTGTDGTANYRLITSVSRADTGIVTIAATGLTGNGATDGEPITIWKPAVEIRRQARVMELTQQYEIDQGIVLNLTFRNTGTATFTKGAPNISI